MQGKKEDGECVKLEGVGDERNRASTLECGIRMNPNPTLTGGLKSDHDEDD
jgi:hypothetical protein